MRSTPRSIARWCAAARRCWPISAPCSTAAASLRRRASACRGSTCSSGRSWRSERAAWCSALPAHVKHQRVFLDLVAVFRGNAPLQLLDLVALEFDDLAGVDVDHVVVVLAAVEFVDG